MLQEALENRPSGETQEPEYVTFNWGKLKKAILKHPQLVTPQKEALIRLLSESGTVGILDDEMEVMEKKLDVYEEFKSKVKEGLDSLKCEYDPEILGYELLREIFKRIINVNIDEFSPQERCDVYFVIEDLGLDDRHKLEDLFIYEAIEDLEDKLMKIESGEVISESA